MGLDMYAYAHEEGKKEGREIMYWRKHAYLHGWMQKLYAKKTGIDDPQSFNTVSVELTLDDLDMLSATLRGNLLPETHGFFFGDFPPDDETMLEDLAFVKKARAEIKAGNKVFYSSWW